MARPDAEVVSMQCRRRRRRRAAAHSSFLYAVIAGCCVLGPLDVSGLRVTTRTRDSSVPSAVFATGGTLLSSRHSDG